MVGWKERRRENCTEAKGWVMDAAETRAAKEQFVRAMAAGSRWDEAAHATGLPMGRTTAYRLYQRYRVMGEAALIDGRHGHPAKMRPAVRGWLADYCRENPTLTNRVVRAALHERWGVAIAPGYLNQVRAMLGVPRRIAPKRGDKPNRHRANLARRSRQSPADACGAGDGPVCGLRADLQRTDGRGAFCP